VVWAVAKGSLVNKAILVPAALVISFFAPWAVTPLLMIGGLFLCYEGVEKLAHKLVRHAPEEAAHRAELAHALVDPSVDMVALERDKIKGAVRTDFILSAEIIAITLGTVATAPFVTQVAVLSGIAVVMTIGVYGLVGGIVKLDDLGMHLSKRAGNGGGAQLVRGLGAGILGAAPWLMKGISVAGTAAMFLVGGGILVHGVPQLAHALEAGVHVAAELPAVGAVLGTATGFVAEALTGVIAGGVVLGLVSAWRAVRKRLTRTPRAVS
jgi:hypothetical protein